MRVGIPVQHVLHAADRIRADSPPGKAWQGGEFWTFDDFQLTDVNQDATEAAKAVRALQLKVDALAGQNADLLQRLEASKAGALRYQTKFETVSELFDRCLNSMKQER